MKDKQWHFISEKSNFFIFAGRAQREVKRAMVRAGKEKKDNTQTVREGDKAQIRSCIYLIDILPLILIEILCPRACQRKPNPLPKDMQHCLKKNLDDDKVIFISSPLAHSLSPSLPTSLHRPCTSWKGEDKLNDTQRFYNTQQNLGMALLLLRRI